MAVAVTLYGRHGCHLCDEARDAILVIAEQRGDIDLVEVDIERDDRLLSTYLERIPVVELEGHEVSELALDPDEFERALHTVRP